MKLILANVTAAAAMLAFATSAEATVAAVGTTCTLISGPASISGGKVRFKK